MSNVSIPAHFDGERILLDEPIELQPNTKLIVTVLGENDAEHESWLRLSRIRGSKMLMVRTRRSTR